MDEVIKILNESTADPAVKLKAWQHANEIAAGFASTLSDQQAGGDVFRMLFQVMAVILPALLEGGGDISFAQIFQLLLPIFESVFNPG